MMQLPLVVAESVSSVEMEIYRHGERLRVWGRLAGRCRVTEPEGSRFTDTGKFLPRVTPERIRNLLLQAKSANHNCVRVWGGHYPGGAFLTDRRNVLWLPLHS